MRRVLWEVAGLIVAVAIASSLVAAAKNAMRRAAAAEALVGVWQAKYAAAVLDVKHDSVRVVATVTKLKTLRDSLNLRDTVQVREYVTQTDTLIQQCLSCTESASKLRGTADSLVGHYADWHNADVRKWYDRLGIAVAYGFQLQPDGRVTRGPAIAASWKIWP